MQQPSSGGAGGTGGELRSDAQQLGKSAANRIHSEVDARKNDAAEQAKSVSNAVHKAASELDNAPNWITSAFEQGAQQIQRFADTLEQKDSRQLVNEAQAFARERPGTFLAACAAAGFAAARILKAGSEQQAAQSPQSGSQAASGGQRQSYDLQSSQGSGAPGGQPSSSTSFETNMRSSTPGEYA